MGNGISSVRDALSRTQRRNPHLGISEQVERIRKQIVARLTVLEEHVISQEREIKSLKKVVSTQENRSHEGKMKIQALANAIKGATRPGGPIHTGKQRMDEQEESLHEIQHILLDMRKKLDAHDSLMNGLFRERNHTKEDYERLVGVLEQGVIEGKEQLRRLEDILDNGKKRDEKGKFTRYSRQKQDTPDRRKTVTVDQ